MRQRKDSMEADLSPLPTAATAAAMECVETDEEPHHIEQEVRRRLLARPDLRFSSLVIRRIEDGVCLEGVLEVSDECPDVCRLVQAVDGVRHVMNHLVVHRTATRP